jgi:hypothetical protein
VRGRKRERGVCGANGRRNLLKNPFSGSSNNDNKDRGGLTVLSLTFVQTLQGRTVFVGVGKLDVALQDSAAHLQPCVRETEGKRRDRDRGRYQSKVVEQTMVSLRSVPALPLAMILISTPPLSSVTECRHYQTGHYGDLNNLKDRKICSCGHFGRFCRFTVNQESMQFGG